MSAQSRTRDGATRRPLLHHVAVWASTLAVLVTSAGAANAEPSPSPSVSPSPEAPALVASPPDAGPVVSVPVPEDTEPTPDAARPVPVAPVELPPIGDSQVIEPMAALAPILPESVTVTVGGGAADGSQWTPSATAPSLPDVVDAIAVGASATDSSGLGSGARWDLLDTEYPRVADGDRVDVTTLTVGPDALGGAAFAVNFDRSSDSPGGAGWMNVSLDTAELVTQGAAGLGDRLTLMAFPSCALTTPERASCVQGVALPTDNAAGVLTALVPVDGDGVSGEGAGMGNARSGRLNPASSALLADLAAAQGVHMVIDGSTIVAAVSKANGPAGTFAATDLGMTGSWSVGEQSGSMSYSIPLDAPAVAVGEAPSLALTYNSATVDGHNLASNGQGSTIGDGWDINIPYIERQYLGCKFDRTNDKTGDLCWQSPYAGKPGEAAYVINLNGQTANLIWDGEARTGVVGYLVDGVPNWRVSRFFGTGSTATNGDNDSEYFKVETPDGSVFYFGYGVTPGTATPTNSVATVPVFGDDAGEPCVGASPCAQGYRWMLDVGVDANSVATLYTYAKTTNFYAVSGVTTNSAAYTSEIVPLDITYGHTFTSPTAALGPTGGKVKFRTLPRCIEGASLNDYLGAAVTCPTKDLAHASSYPDVPVDLICSVAPCTSAQSSPAFFHTLRITGIEMYSGTDSLVSQTVLVANFPPVSDGGNRSLWLDSVYTKYTGVDGSTATTYRTEFVGLAMPNRVDSSLQDSRFERRRIVRIFTDSGSAIDVDYSSDRTTKCIDGTTPYSTLATIAAPAMDCYQVMLTDIDGTPKYGTFNKYLVNTVTVSDLVGGQPAMETKYEYLDEPAWGYGNDLLRPDGQNDQTWSSWRGYGQVKVSTLAPVPGAPLGAVPPVVSTTTNTYFRGLDTDYLPGDDRGRVASLNFDPPGVAPVENVVDAPSLQGMLFHSETHDADGKLVSQTRNQFEARDWLPSAVSFSEQAAPTYVVGNFNGDATEDELFAVAQNGAWKYWSPVTREWTDLWAGSDVRRSDLRFGNFDGVGATDVFTVGSGGQWKFSSGGAAGWENLWLDPDATPLSRLRFGDFNHDGKTDVFSRTATGQWRYSSGGAAAWTNLWADPESTPIADLRFGDFNGDGTTDVFSRTLTGQWRYSSGGAVAWANLGSDASLAIGQLAFANVTGGAATDLLSNAASGQWQVASGGTTPWAGLAGSPTTRVENLLFGNFDGVPDAHADALFHGRDGWRIVTGDKIAAKLDPATAASTDVSGEDFPNLAGRPHPAAMDGIVVLPSGSDSWSFTTDSLGPELLYAHSESSTVHNDDALPIEEKTITTGGGKTFTTRTTTDYVWGYGGATAVHNNPGHLQGFGTTTKHIVLPWDSATYSNDGTGEVLTGHVQVFYDGKTSAETNVPSAGLPTQEKTLGVGGVWRTAKATYDLQGRILTAQDPGDVAAANGRQTSWVYPVPTAPTSMDVKVTSPDGVVNHTWYDFRVGGPTKAVTTEPTETEAVGQWTHYKYNAAGMLVAGWGPLQWPTKPTDDPSTPPGASVVPTVSYAYDIFTNVPALRTTPTVVTTMSLAGPNGSGGWVMASQAGTVRRSYQYLDGLLRPIETHSVAQDGHGGTVVTASGYDALGQVAWTTGPFELKDAQGNRMTAAASNPLANPDPNTKDQVTWNLHDTSWRAQGTKVTGKKLAGMTVAPVLSESSTETTGLTTTTTDPTGLKTIAVSDVSGRLVSQKQVPAGVDPSAVPEETAYNYSLTSTGTPAVLISRQTTVKDTELHVTTLTTDFEGRKVSLDDPNSGFTSYEYDPNYSSRVTAIRAGADEASLTEVTTMEYIDPAGRLTSRTSKVKVGDPAAPLGVTSSSATWEYDTGAKFGELKKDTATTVVDGVSYELKHDYTHDTKHRPETVTTTLPSDPSLANVLGDLLAKTYTTTAHYDDVTGVQVSTEFATAIGGLPAETVTTGFDRLGRGVSLTVGANNFQLVKNVEWDATGLLTSRTYGDDAVRTLEYDVGTRSVKRMIAGVVGGTTFQDDLYVRDGDTNSDGTIDVQSTGTLTSITDAATASAPVSQCYAYSGLNRLESAWTVAGSGSGCESSFAATAPADLYTSGTGYASAWEYSTAGTITSVDDLLASPPTSRDYAYGAANPAAVVSITNPEIPAIPAVPAEPPSEAHPDGVPEVPGVLAVSVAADTFTYDALGRMKERVTHEVNTATRTVTPHTLTLTWDASSNLVKTDLDGTEVVYAYDSSGQRVAQIGVTAGTATAYLGATEVTDPNTGVNATLPADLVGTTFITGTRYYSLGGATVAVREAPTTASPTDKLSFLFGDVQGSAQVMVTHTIDPSTHQINPIADAIVSRNAYTPYGTTRGEGTSADNDKLTVDHGWLNQVSDEASTGLVYLNARYYDPHVARFVSPDPQMNPSDPKTLDPYRYAENNPITYSDASGLGPVCTGLSGTALANCNAYANGNKNYMTGAAAKPKSPSIFAKINAYRKGAWGLVGGTAKWALWDYNGLVTAYGFYAHPQDEFHKKLDPAISYAKNWWGTAQSVWSFATGGGETLSGVGKHYDQMFTGGQFHTGNELDKWNGAGILGGLVGLSLFLPGVKSGAGGSSLEVEAVAARDALAAKGGSATYVGAWDATTGEVTAGGSIKNVAALGHGLCAEAVCLSDLVSRGSQPANVMFTGAVGLRSGVMIPIPVCAEFCQPAYPTTRFAPGVTGQPWGVWYK